VVNDAHKFGWKNITIKHFGDLEVRVGLNGKIMITGILIK
jgi:hypothetical protein